MQPDVLPDLQEQVDGGVPVGAVRGGALQRHAVDLLRADQVQRGPPHHHQRRRLRDRDHLHRHVPRLRPQESQGSIHVIQTLALPQKPYFDAGWDLGTILATGTYIRLFHIYRFVVVKYNN